MEIITRKMFSLCEDFNPDESEELEIMYNYLSECGGCDSYITYIAHTKETLNNKGYSEDLIANKLVELGADDGEVVFIHIDY